MDYKFIVCWDVLSLDQDLVLIQDFIFSVFCDEKKAAASVKDFQCYSNVKITKHCLDSTRGYKKVLKTMGSI